MASHIRHKTISLISTTLLYSSTAFVSASSDTPAHVQSMLDEHFATSQSFHSSPSGDTIAIAPIIIVLIIIASIISIIIRAARKSGNTNPVSSHTQYNVRQNTRRKKYTPDPRPKPSPKTTPDFDTQLRQLHKLHQDNILSSTEYQNQKQIILDKLAQQ